MKRSLHIGINYQNTEYALPDCDLDALAMLEISKQHKYNAVLYAGNEISADEFLAELISIREHSNANSLTFLSYSGHGAQYYSTTEKDRQEEALVFWDGREISLFPDDDFRSLLFEIKGTVFVVLDCCFSGGMERTSGKPGRKRRFIETPENAKVVRYAPDLKRAARSANRGYFLNASLESEVSWSTGEGGLFTRALTKTYNAATLKQRSIANLIKQCKAECGTEQTPNFSIYGGNATKRVF